MPAKNVLVIDVGGTHVKVGASDQKDIVKIESGLRRRRLRRWSRR